ncbi:hypothetical protein CBR_g34173 [Chara braunii]|uniref:UDP-glucose 4-epimerase n=1 Tax=Chara braunii TaxID=69332 RepID=A0A388LID0_CHABU|nr:hypothetical protein CBR_g34173 [Chara braunii]|eukprot:GBG81993.1 hypothetical protein CBR_g34173 [Chara braunii]
MGETIQHGGGAQEIVLVTGGAGYIGSHTVVELLQQGYFVVIVDNLYNSAEECVNRVRELVGDRSQFLAFHKADICDTLQLDAVFRKYKTSAVVHFAGLKAVGESVAEPLKYYKNNVAGTLNLLECMKKYDCKKLVFSSSATVYGQPKSVPCMEDFPLQAANPYGRTKLFIEEILNDLYESDKTWRIIMLRYFNPVGAHPSGRIGEDPAGIPNNLMPFVEQVAVGRRKELSVFGKDYPTRDGTGIRDYIHVLDLAAGHVAALRKLAVTPDIGCEPYNLGTGRGTSVLEMVAAFEKASGKKIPLRISDRRPGDCAEVFGSTKKAEEELGWKAKLSIEDMCRDQWRWACKNPWGYREHYAAEAHKSAPSAGETEAGLVKQEQESEPDRSKGDAETQAKEATKTALQGRQVVPVRSTDAQKGEGKSGSPSARMADKRGSVPARKLTKSATVGRCDFTSGQDSVVRVQGKPEKGSCIRKGVEENVQAHGKRQGDVVSNMGNPMRGTSTNGHFRDQRRKNGSTTSGAGNVTSALPRSLSIGPGTGTHKDRCPLMSNRSGSAERRPKVQTAAGSSVREFAHEVTNDILFQMTTPHSRVSIPALIYHGVMSGRAQDVMMLSDACNSGWIEAVVGAPRAVPPKVPCRSTIIGSNDLSLGTRNGLHHAFPLHKSKSMEFSGMSSPLNGLHHAFPLPKGKGFERSVSARHPARFICETMHVRSHMVGLFQKAIDKTPAATSHLCA